MIKNERLQPITLGEYERRIMNITIYDTLNEEQKNWLDYFMFTYEYSFSDFVLKQEDQCLIIIINTGTEIKQIKI
jgi:hypothetical protein